MSEQSGQQGAVSRQLSSPRFSIYEEPLTKTEHSAPIPRHRQTSELQEPDTITNVSPLSPQPETSEGRSLGQIMVILVVLLVLVNIPISHYGAGLAQIIPDATAMIIHDGLILKGSGPKIYVLEDYKLRWISSPEAFNHYFRQHNVQTVEDSLLEQLEKGQPIHRLVKCQDSSYVYALEGGLKRWVKDPPAQNKSKPWDAVLLVSCDYLRSLPDGMPIPEDVGLPP